LINDDDLVTELIDYKCGDCGSEDWTLKIGRRSDGKVFLIITCGNPACVEKKRLALGASEDALIIWDELDITDSHYGNEEDDYPTEVN
jgi:hypothetical protein